jgi:thiol-disulfide isomerase/thioredoxin
MSNNPLKQYFRRPSIYVKLPSECRYYDDDTVQRTETGEFPVYPMTAIDEITAKTPDAVFNGQAVIDIIHSCIPNIKNAWKINTIDIETIMIAIRVASSGEYMEMSSVCPNCKEESTYDINLIDLLSQQKEINYENSITVGDLKIRFRPLTYTEVNKNSLAQYELQKVYAIMESMDDSEEKKLTVKNSMSKLNELMSSIIASTIDSIITPETTVVDKEHIKEYLNNCDRKVSEFIREHSAKLKAENEIKPIKLKCTHCEHQYDHKLILNVTDFFD